MHSNKMVSCPKHDLTPFLDGYENFLQPSVWRTDKQQTLEVFVENQSGSAGDIALTCYINNGSRRKKLEFDSLIQLMTECNGKYDAITFRTGNYTRYRYALSKNKSYAAKCMTIEEVSEAGRYTVAYDSIECFTGEVISHQPMMTEARKMTDLENCLRSICEVNENHPKANLIFSIRQPKRITVN
ncbi:MAG: hypothetical protein QM500_09390 [Methylococcales bacterium]